MNTNKFVHAVLRFYIAPIVNFIVGISTIYITTRMFTPEEYGQINVFNAAANVFMIFACFGFDQGFIRFFHETPTGWSLKELYRFCLRVVFVGWGICSVILLLFYKQISILLFHQENFYAIFLLCVFSMSIIFLNRFANNYYRVQENAKYYTIQQIITNTLMKMTVMMSILFSLELSNILFFNTIGVFAFFLILLITQRNIIIKNIPCLDHRILSVTKFSVTTWPTSVMFMLATFITPLLITMRMDSYDVGIYTSTNVFSSVIGVLTSGFLTYWSVFIYKNYKKEQDFIKKVHNYIIISILIILSGMIILQHVAYLFIGEQFQSGRYFFTLVIVDTLLMFLGESTQYGIAITKKVYQSTLIFAIALILKIVGTWVVLPIAGLLGAAVVAAIAATVRFVLLSWRGQKYYQSIESVRKTFVGIILIWMLALSNCVFIDDYIKECLAVSIILSIALAVYYSNFKDMTIVIKRKLLK